MSDKELMTYLCARLDPPHVESTKNLLNGSGLNMTTLGEVCRNHNIVHSIDITDILGPRRGPLAKVIPITVVYILIFITGLIGNITTCFVIACNRYMHTATNYYLFNLAVTDILVLVLGLPQELYAFWSAYPWIFGEAFCIFRTFAAEACSNASILSITAFTIERYIAICHPLRSKLFALSKLGRSLKIIAVLWVISCLCALPLSLQFGLEYEYDNQRHIIPESLSCTQRRKIVFSFEVSTFLFFFTPMTILLVLYVLMGIVIYRASKQGNRDELGQGGHYETRVVYHNNQRLRSRRSVIKLLVAVVVAFFVCWAPFHSQRLMVIYVTKWTRRLLAIQNTLFYISGVLYYISSTINPILYNIMSQKFRQAFKTTLTTCCNRRRGKHRAAAVSYQFKMNTRTQPSSSSQESGQEIRRYGTAAMYAANGHANVVLATPTVDTHCAQYFDGPCSVP